MTARRSPRGPGRDPDTRIGVGEQAPSIPDRTPPPWLNAVMTTMLRTPGLQRVLGRRTALLSLTGRRSGRRYTIPVTYDREGERVVILTRRRRAWWRNLPDRPDVELRLAGVPVRGTAELSVGDPDGLARLVTLLRHRPLDAAGLGVRVSGGRVDEDAARLVLPHLVIVTVTLTPPSGRRATGT